MSHGRLRDMDEEGFALETLNRSGKLEWCVECGDKPAIDSKGYCAYCTPEKGTREVKTRTKSDNRTV